MALIKPSDPTVRISEHANSGVCKTQQLQNLADFLKESERGRADKACGGGGGGGV